MRKLAILVAPFRDRDEHDIEELNDAKLKLLLRGWLPIFLPDTLKDILDDHEDDQRTVSVNASAYWCSTMAKDPDAEMIVVGSGMTEGMQSDVQAWLDAGGPAPRNIADLGEEEETDGGDD